ncbi:MAG: 4'-phosphopantetheinyl transferase family protein [Pseudomonadota bacterium]
MSDLASIRPGEPVLAGLRDGQVQVWYMDLRSLSVGGLERWAESVLDEEARSRAEAIRLPDARRDHLGSQLALRSLLSAYCPVVPRDGWKLVRQAGGRPRMVAVEPVTGRVPFFSVTHSDGVVMLAFHRFGEVGVDIEPESRRIDGMPLARRYFAPLEVAELEALRSADQQNAFLRLWTLKEASVKADGAGLAGEMRRRYFSMHDGTIQTGPVDSHHWQYWSLRLARHWLVAVALRHPLNGPWPGVECMSLQLSLADGSIRTIRPDVTLSSTIS